MWVTFKKRIRRHRYICDTFEALTIPIYHWGTCCKSTYYYEWQWWEQWEGRQYVRKPYHKKKIKTEKDITRDDWRKHNQFNKDASKGLGWCRGFSKRYYKKHANKSHRQWERHNIHHENWDILTVDYTKWTHDPWDIY